jgi:hypothetical protein
MASRYLVSGQELSVVGGGARELWVITKSDPPRTTAAKRENVSFGAFPDSFRTVAPTTDSKTIFQAAGKFHYKNIPREVFMRFF